jgi:hypothetical protein
MARDCTSMDSYYFTSGSAHYVMFDTAPNGGTLNFIRCLASETTYNSNAGGIIYHVATPGVGGFDRANIVACRITNCGFTYQPNDTTDNYFQNCTALGCLNGWTAGTSPANIYMDNCQWINTNSSIGSRPILIVSQSNATSKWFIDGFLCSTANQLGGAIAFSNNGSITLTNSQFNCSGATRVVLRVNTPQVVTINANGNAYVGQADVYLGQGGSTINLTSDNNCFDVNATQFIINGSTYNTVATYQAGTGQDTHSTIGSCNVSMAGVLI